MQPGPGAEQLERKQRSYAETVEMHFAAFFGWNFEIEDPAFARFEIVDTADNAVDVDLQMRPAVLRMVGDRHLELSGLPGEYGIHARERDFQADEIALTLVHGYKAQADQEKGEHK